MPFQLGKPESRFRIVNRRPTRQTVKLVIRPARPSLLDLRLQGDPWILAHGNQTVGVYFDNCLMVTVAALALDAPGLNMQLHALRHRNPRRRR